MQFEEQDQVKLKTACDRCHQPSDQCTCTQPAVVAASEKDDTRAEEALVMAAVDPLKGRQYIGGKYKILTLLGRGGMGTVYKVKHEALDKIFALKILNKDVTTNVKTLLRFDQEAKAVGNLQHENLISVHDYGASEDGIPYLVMDYLDGVELSQEIASLGCIEETRALMIFERVAEGLSYAHSKGVIHRDLKPSNIMLVKNDKGVEKPIIVDFGIAKRQTVDKNLTQTGEIFGTPVYMSPEQCMGNPVDARSDIYSLGCVMFEALNGKPPLNGDNAVKTIFKHLNEEAPLLRVNSAQTVSSGLEKVVASCLEKDPQHRLQSADSVAENLRRVSAGEQPLTKHKPRSIKRAQLIKGAAYVSIAGLIILALLALAIKSLQHETPAQALMTQATKKLSNEKYSEAIVLAQQALVEGAKEHAGEDALMRIHELLVTCYANSHNYEKAAAESRLVVKYAEHLNDMKQLDLYAPRVPQYEAQVDPEKALEDYGEAVSIEARKKNPNQLTLLTRNVAAGAAAVPLKRNAEARTYLETARKITETLKEVPMNEKYRINFWLAKTYAAIGDYDKALNALKEAETVSSKMQSNPKREESLANERISIEYYKKNPNHKK